MNSDNLFPLLDSERDSMKFYEFASLVARGEIPGEVMEILRMGRITALSMPDGSVRGVTVGDILRRLVARTVAQQYNKELRLPRHLFSTHYQRAWDASALRTSSRRSLASMRRP